MTKEEMDRSRRRRNECHTDRREAYRSKEPSQSSKGIGHKDHRVENNGERHHRHERKPLKSSDHHGRSNHNRKEWRNRNSPVELIVRGCRSTGSSSSSEESTERKQSRGKHDGGRKRHREESFEELSRRKRKIESELNALDALEAAAREEEKTQRSQNRESSRREKKGDSSANAPEASAKEQDEKVHRSQNRNHSEDKRGDRTIHHGDRPARSREDVVRIKEEPVSPDDRRSRHHVSNDARGQQVGSQSKNEDQQNWGQASEPVAKPKEKPNFATSGKLAEDTNTYNGVVIKYNEPPEAHRPKRKWRLYPFKGSTNLPFIPVHRQSAYLLGRTRLIADIPIDHPSCSKQHAVLQYRALPYKRDNGTTGRRVRPYIIDLGSSNGTYVNNKQIEPQRYVELLERDVLKFGFSTREYVILHEESKHDQDEVDIP